MSETKNQRIHFIAIGGAVMHNMAIALHNKGHRVSGSDDEIFEPARTNLDRHGLLPEKQGWFAEKITPDIDAVILGMHAKNDNPELEKATGLGLKIYSFPEYLYQHSKQKTRVVIAGSHGKTTITSMVMHVLRQAGKDFDYLVGAKVEGFDVMVKLTDAPIMVIEGDEYLTSPTDPRPKFLHYHPHIALISGIAWDHINVFPSWEGYKQQFELFIQSIGKQGTLVYCADDAVLQEVISRCSANKNYPDKVLPYHEFRSKIENGTTYLVPAENNQGEIPLRIFGRHNLQNLAGANLVCRALGIGDADFYRAISTFTGAARRLECIAQNDTTTVYKDFAHAPSKVAATVAAIQNQYPERRLIAVLELHTFSSLSKHFLSHYRHSLDPADVAAVFYSHHALELKKLPPITPQEVIDGFGRSDLKVFTQADDLQDFLLTQNYTKSNLLMMSSGSFDGIDQQGLAKKIVSSVEK
ncbi:MAG: peptidoglycan synthetase [Clostridia bacterium]|nr:peptidoglycan synthetase [Clostridia bacterium]